MNSKTSEVTYCKRYQYIFDGVIPGVILSFEDTLNETPKHHASMKVAVGEMTEQEYLELYSPYYKLNPHLKTFHTN